MEHQPIRMKTRSGPILSMPCPIEVNDARGVIWHLHSLGEFADLIVDHFDEMLAEPERQPLACPISLHPFMMGRPYRIRQLRRALEDIARQRGRVWIARPPDICAQVEELPAGRFPGNGS